VAVFEPEAEGIVLDAEETGGDVVGRSPWALAGRRLLRNKLALGAGALFLVIVAVSLAAPLYAHHVAQTDPFEPNLSGTFELNGKTIQVIQQGGGKLGLGDSGAVVQVTEAKDDAAPAKISIYAPQGYTGTVTGTPGTQLGTVHADLQALQISADAIIQAEGTILTDDPAKYTTNTCSPGTHTAVWLLHVTVSGTTLDVPVYVDAPGPASDPLAQGAPVRLQLCLASPYAEAGTARAPFGAKIINAALTLNQGVLVNPSTRGLFPWRTIITPYTVNSGTPNAGGTVEARAMVNLPTALTLSAKVKTTRHKVKVHGKTKTRVTNAVILTG